MERLADDLVHRAGPIVLSGVNVVDPTLDRRTQHAHRFVTVSRRSEDVVAGQLHGAVSRSGWTAGDPVQMIRPMPRSECVSVTGSPEDAGHLCPRRIRRSRPGLRSLRASWIYAMAALCRWIVRSFYNNTSRTLEIIGVAEDIERSGQYQPLRPRLYQMDREMQVREMRQLSASPDWVVGSVHALTEQGSLLIASASGSQLGPIASGAGHVLLVIGAEKIVPDFDTGLRRIYDYCFPLEDRRARQAYGFPVE